MATLKMGSTTMLTESSGALTVNVSDPTITLGSNTTFSGDAGQKTAKVWLSVDTTTTIKDSFNVSSITYTGTGNWTVAFSSALSNADYSVSICTGGNTASASGASFTYHGTQFAMSTGSCGVNTTAYNVGTALSNPTHWSLIIFGD